MSIDLTLRILKAKNLPRTDVIGHTDPYVLLTVSQDETTIRFKTGAQYSTKNPTWLNEELHLTNVSPSCVFHFEVYDYNMIISNAFSCCTEQACLPMDIPQVKYGPPGSWVEKDLALVKQQGGSPVGALTVQVSWRPACSPREVQLRHQGPVRYRVTLSPKIGKLLGMATDGWRAYAAYKLKLSGTRLFFPEGESLHWNESYAPAVKIFKTKGIVLMVKAEHALLYTDRIEMKENGLLRDGEGLMSLLAYGVRGKERRYFTYVLLEDCFCFSETAASFLADMLSKHAMHANCAEKIVCAGEFCVMPSLRKPSGHRLMLDNNSGTYAPPATVLPPMRDLLCYNFPGLEVEVIKADDPTLQELHESVPSRLKA